MRSNSDLAWLSKLFQQIVIQDLVITLINNLNSNQTTRSECHGTPVLLEMKLHYMMGKLVMLGGRQEVLFSPWKILTDHRQGLIQVSDTNFASSIFNTSYLLAGDLKQWRSDTPTLIFPYWQFLGSGVYLRENFYFHSSFDTADIWFLRHH